MSIILKALKKIQEQEAGGQSAPLSGDSTQGHSPEGTSVEPGRAASFSSAERQSFGLAPKALIGLLVVLAICTTGWFASKIYLNVKLAAGASAPAVSQEAPGVSPKAPAVSPAAPVLAVAALDLSPVPVLEQATPSQEPEGIPAKTAEPIQSVKVDPRPTAPAEVRNPEPSRNEVVPEIETPIIESTIVEVSAVDISGMKRSPDAVEKVPEKKGRPEFKINAIAWKNAEPRAIVNMQSIYEGDVIEGATVVAIKRKIVIFEYEGETFEVRF